MYTTAEQGKQPDFCAQCIHDEQAIICRVAEFEVATDEFGLRTQAQCDWPAYREIQTGGIAHGIFYRRPDEARAKRNNTEQDKTCGERQDDKQRAKKFFDSQLHLRSIWGGQYPVIIRRKVAIIGKLVDDNALILRIPGYGEYFDV